MNSIRTSLHYLHVQEAHYNPNDDFDYMYDCKEQE